MDNVQVVVFCGVLNEYQGIDLLLEAIPLVAQRMATVKFLIIGYPNEEWYRQKARALGVERLTHFTGKIPYEQVPRYLALADVAVSPKISSTEANLKLFEYMAMGLPTVVFDNPVNREILGDLGLYARMGDPEDLARVLLGTLWDREGAKRLGHQSRQRAEENCSWLSVGKRLIGIYESTQQGRRQPKNDVY
jgi:glycosyltransferase involved in cell wall biosynthesis